MRLSRYSSNLIRLASAPSLAWLSGGVRSVAKSCSSSTPASSTQVKKRVSRSDREASSSINLKRDAISDSSVLAANLAAKRLLCNANSRNLSDVSFLANKTPRHANNPITANSKIGPTIPSNKSGRRNRTICLRWIASNTCCTLAKRSSGFLAMHRSTMPTSQRSIPRTR